MLRTLALFLLVYSNTITAGDSDDIMAKHRYFLSGAPCSNQEDVNDYGEGDWIRCILNEQSVLQIKWRSWVPSGLSI